MAKSCTRCESAAIYYAHTDSSPTEEELYVLFHQPCSGCTVQNSWETSMCSTCQHLRLQHIVRCLSLEIRRRFQFRLWNKLNEKHSTKCPLCQLFTDMLKAGLGKEEFTRLSRIGYDIFLYLGYLQHPKSAESNRSSADLYASYPNGDGIENVWIGDLCIDNVEEPILPLVEGVISWPSLKQKITQCFGTHERCQCDPKIRLPKGFRVIDVIKRHVVEVDNCSFVALSYVWGVDQRGSLLTALGDTIEDMRKEGGLPASRMPQTIEDAMLVCAQLGHKHLWVDRLCIIQDDLNDKANQIEAMGDIYSSASLVLIVAHGNGMDYGIPGVIQQRNQVQRTVHIQDLRLTNLVREIENDPLSVWDTRGWTYQEAVLARKRLYFTDARVFFECEQSVFHEDRFNHEKIRDELISIRLTAPEDKSRFESFARHLKHYTSRKLTYRSDVYNAIKGIFKILYKEESTFLYGLPLDDFDHALLWYSDFGRQPTKRYEFEEVVLPSWSWSSNAGLSEQVLYQATTFYSPLVSWYCMDKAWSGGTTRILNACSGTNLDKDWQLYMAIACGDGCLESVSFSYSLEIDTFEDVRGRFDSRWEDYPAFKNEMSALTLEISESQQRTDVGYAQHVKPGVIFTRCITMSLGLALKSRYGLNIVDSAGKRIGELCGDEIVLREAVASSDDTSAKFDFIALSLSGLNIYPYSSEELGMKNYYDVDGNALPKVPVVNVLMIGWEGGYAHRLALGWIFLTDWSKLERGWTCVQLQ